ncbi:transcription initiation factor IIE subunit beta-like [Montipora capricornis]|uniref:transcription initiation factor IIE subunit beta-like n=1 Tax=Montipora capricornis TaxID=246305 RepID=UPI0035F16267
MDPSLLKDLKDFKARSIKQPTVESKKSKPAHSTSDQPKSKSKEPKRSYLPKELLQPKKPASPSIDYKTHTFRSKHKFAVLAAIVDFMKNRHLQRKFEALSVDEILDQINYTDISPSDKAWLANEALKGNSKLVHKDGKFSFKPKYYVKDKKQLLKLLERHEESGSGGILLDDIRESLPDADEVVKAAGRRITFITRPTDKKVVLFFKNDQHQLKVDEEFQKHWRGVSVDGIGENDIEKYLVNAGIATMQDSGVRKPQQAKQKRKPIRRFKKLNTHLDESTLKDYSQS